MAPYWQDQERMREEYRRRAEERRLVRCLLYWWIVLNVAGIACLLAGILSYFITQWVYSNR